MGWLIALLVIVCLAILPLGVKLRYNSQGAAVWILLGPLRLQLLPRKKGQAKQKKKEKPKEKEKKRRQVGKAQPDSGEKQEETGGSVLDFLPLVQTVLDFLGDFRRKLRVDNLEMIIIMAGGDPCDLAINYGRAWAAVGNLIPKLEQFFVIKKRNIEVECDFTAAETKITAGADITITLGRLTAAAVRFGWRAIKQFLKIQKKRKGGVKQ